MRVYWENGALNLRPESEEDGAITSAILFAYGNRLHITERVLEIGASRGFDNADQQPVIGVNVGLDSVIEGVPSGGSSNEPLRE